MTAPHQLYPNCPECIIVVFDLRDPGAVEQLHRERTMWQEHSDIEALSECCFALILRPGVAQRLVA